MKFLFILLFAFAAQAGEPIATHGNGYLEELDGIPVLHLKGTPAEMGEQYGFLVGDRVHAAIELIEKLARKGAEGVPPVPVWLIAPLRWVVGWLFYLQFPDATREEIKGMVRGAKERGVKLDKYDVSFLNSIIDIVGIAHMNASFLHGNHLLEALGLSWLKSNCDSFAAWGPRTVGGKTFQTRNVDVPVGMGLEQFPIVVVTKQDGAIPFVSAAFMGMTGMFTGMNAAGVAMGQVWAFSQVRSVGTPWQIRMAEVMKRATTAREAATLMGKTGSRTYGSNFVFADPTGDGYAVEETPKDYVIFSSNDPKEKLALWNGEQYGIPLENAVLRGDAALDPRVRSYQTASNGPHGDPRESNAYKNRYKGQADRILAYEQAGILIGQPEAETISRDTAMRGGSLQATVYANTDRELWVSYAMLLEDGTIQQAYEGTYHHIPFASYLDSLERRRGRFVIRHEVTGQVEDAQFSPDFSVNREGDAWVLRRSDGTFADRLAID